MKGHITKPWLMLQNIWRVLQMFRTICDLNLTYDYHKQVWAVFLLNFYSPSWSLPILPTCRANLLLTLSASIKELFWIDAFPTGFSTHRSILCTHTNAAHYPLHNYAWAYLHISRSCPVYSSNYSATCPSASSVSLTHHHLSSHTSDRFASHTDTYITQGCWQGCPSPIFLSSSFIPGISYL